MGTHLGTREEGVKLPCDCLPWVGCEKCEAVVDARGWLA
jgi:hypothetical protein